jgi:hypothetical protein
MKEVTDTEGVTHDEIVDVISRIKKHLGSRCMFPVETTHIKKFRNDSGVPMYSTRIMFMVSGENDFTPHVVGVDADVVNGKVVKAVEQEVQQPSAPTSRETDNFLPFQEIETFNIYKR